MNLGKVEFEKQLKIKDNKAFAWTEPTNNYEKINGCEFFKALKNRDAEIESELAEHKAQINELEMEQLQNKSQMLDLEKAGYCDLDEKVYTRIGGVVTAENYGHRKNCSHKGE